MSRSVKKNPVVKDMPASSKQNKQLANRKIRRKLKDVENDTIGNGANYQKHSESWDIHDYVSRWSLEEALASYRSESTNETINTWGYRWHDDYPTEESFINFWKKCMVRK